MKSLRLILSYKRYFAVVWVFCSLNIMIGTWVLYIPQVKEKLNLDDGQIGLALFCLALGLLSIIPFLPWLTKTIGLGRCTFIGISLFSIMFIFPVLTTSYVWLCISLYIVGIFSGFTDISMNTLVSEIEKRDNVNFMSSAHGFFSLGGAIGATLGMVIMNFIKTPLVHFMIMSGLVIGINFILIKSYYHIKESIVEHSSEKVSINSYMPLIVLAILAMIVMGNEGAIEQWSSIYLKDIVNVTSENLVGLGFTIFSITMTIGRFLGDGISEKIGSVKVIVLGCVLAVLGYILVLSNSLVFTVVGFGIIGLGFSVIIPELIRLAGKTKTISASKAISFVTGTGFAGFMVGPIIMGYISDAFTLQVSFSFLLIITFVAVILSIFFIKPNRI
jgi:MFS family permease